MIPGTPAAATTMSAVRTCAARSRVPVWHRVTVAFSLRRVSSRPSGRPTVTPRPTTTTSAPAIGTSWRRSSSTIPCGVHGSGAGLPSTSQPRFVGCSPSASLAGSIWPEDVVLAHLPGQRQLDDVAGARRVGVQGRHVLLDLRLGGVGRQVHPDRGDPDLGAVLVLAVDVPPGAGVVADQDGAQAGHHALLTQRGDPGAELPLDRLGGRGAVEDLCRHEVIQSGVRCRAGRFSGRSAGCR